MGSKRSKTGKSGKARRGASATETRLRERIAWLKEELEIVNRARFEEKAHAERESARLEALVFERTAERDKLAEDLERTTAMRIAAQRQVEGWLDYFRETPLGRLVAASESIIDGQLPEAEDA